MARLSFPRRPLPLRFDILEDRLTPTFPVAANGLPLLSSRPTAPSVIYLDLDGNANPVVTAYDEDGNGTTYNTTEQNNIYEGWRQLAAFYAPFDVDVTTIYPSPDRPKAWIAAGNNISGGYSYVGVFPNTIVESFNQSSDLRGRVSGLAHEVGHNFGLSHNSAFDALGNQTAEYIGKFDPLHGVIMGVDYDGLIHKFANWHTSGNPSALQNDVTFIANKLKVYETTGVIDGMAPDDVGNTIAAATPMTVAGTAQTATGVIERLTDIDAFSFASTGGSYSVTAAPDLPSGVDTVLEIYNAAGTRLGIADTENNGQTLTLTLPAGTFYALVSSKGNIADLGGYNLTVTPGPVAGWQTRNIGLQANTGSTSFDGTTFTVNGSGADIWNNADEFQFAYRALSGNGTITARVTGMDNTNASAKSGVMIRDTLAAGSRYAYTANTYGVGTAMQTRTATDGTSSSFGAASATFAPRWVRLTRNGSTITAEKSTDGVVWSTISTQTVTMGTTVYVGLATTAHNASTINHSTYTNVATSGFTDPTLTTNALLAAPAATIALAATGSGIVVNWNAIAGATGYSIERSLDGVTFVPYGTTTSAVTFTDAPTTSQRYYFRVRAADATGQSDPSTAVTIINRPVAVTNLASVSWTANSIILNWSDTSNENGYRVERSSDGGVTWATLTTTAKNTPSFTVNGLAIGTTYVFRVTPTSGLGDGVAATITESTRLATVVGNVGTVTATTAQLNWFNVTGATGFRIERSPETTTWTTIANVGTGVVTYTDSPLTAETKYYYRITAFNPYSESVAPSAVLLVATAPTTPIAAPWTGTDIGTPSSTRGESSLAAGTFKIIAGGSDIGGTSDQFRYVYQTLIGNFAISARVVTAESTGGNATSKAGVMIRESLGASARFVDLFVTPAAGLAMNSRTTTGAAAISNGTAAGMVPQWVRLVRKDSTITGFTSSDGVNWTPTGTVTISGLGTTLYLGLAATAASTTLLNTSTFDSVSIAMPPTVAGVQIDDGSSQRSIVRSTTVTFSGLVTLPATAANAFTVDGPNGSVAFTVDLSGSTATQTIAKLLFGGSVPDGLDTLTVLGSQVADASPLLLGTMNFDSTTGFHRLFGDGDGDRDVDLTDLGLFRASFTAIAPDPAYNVAFDYDIDGDIDITDLGSFRDRFGMSI